MKKHALLMSMYEKGTLCSTSIIEPNMFAHNTLLAKLMDGKVLAATLTDVCSFVTLTYWLPLGHPNSGEIEIHNKFGSALFGK